MSNPSLTLTVQRQPASGKVLVELDADRFERVAADLGFFTREFTESVERSEKEISQKKLKRLRSLRDLRT